MSGATRARNVRPAEPIASDRKATVNLRIETETRRLIDHAATSLGKTRTDFMVECARRQAIDVLLDQRLFALEPDRFDAFARALDAASAPGEKLRALMKRTPAWER